MSICCWIRSIYGLNSKRNRSASLLSAATIPALPTPNANPVPPTGNARPAPPAANALPAACGRRWAIGRGTDVVVKRPVVEVRCGRGWGRCGSKTRRCKCEKAS